MHLSSRIGTLRCINRTLSMRGSGFGQAVPLACMTAVTISVAAADDLTDARTLYKSGKYQEALTKFRAAAHQHPKDATVFWNLGFTYRKLANYHDAVGAF